MHKTCRTRVNLTVEELHHSNMQPFPKNDCGFFFPNESMANNYSDGNVPITDDTLKANNQTE